MMEMVLIRNVGVFYALQIVYSIWESDLEVFKTKYQ